MSRRLGDQLGQLNRGDKEPDQEGEEERRQSRRTDGMEGFGDGFPCHLLSIYSCFSPNSSLYPPSRGALVWTSFLGSTPF